MNATQMTNRLNHVYKTIDLSCLTDSQIEDLYKITDFKKHYNKKEAEETLVNWIVCSVNQKHDPWRSIKKILVANKQIINDMEL